MASLEALLRQRLKSSRFEHTRGVARMAVELAERHGVDPERAARAAWLHDCGKGLEREEQLKLLGRCGADAEEKGMPPLWHAPVGAWLAKKEYGEKDPEILRAIRFHSTGAPGLTSLQKLLFVADYIEPGRPDWAELKELRPLARKDLAAAFIEVLRCKMADLLEHKRPLHSRSVKAWHFELKQRREP
jgi:predicted HD superfamily hydrolase involved in NAD metabolism